MFFYMLLCRTGCQDLAISQDNVGMIQLQLMVKVFNINLRQGRSLFYSHRLSDFWQNNSKSYQKILMKF